jgi:hypothetical protein
LSQFSPLSFFPSPISQFFCSISESIAGRTVLRELQPKPPVRTTFIICLISGHPSAWRHSCFGQYERIIDLWTLLTTDVVLYYDAVKIELWDTWRSVRSWKAAPIFIFFYKHLFYFFTTLILHGTVSLAGRQ